MLPHQKCTEVPTDDFSALKAAGSMNIKVNYRFIYTLQDIGIN